MVHIDPGCSTLHKQCFGYILSSEDVIILFLSSMKTYFILKYYFVMHKIKYNFYSILFYDNTLQNCPLTI